MRPSGADWVERLPSDLQAHRTLLRGLLREAERDARIRVFVVGCSLGREAADRLSDIDCYLGVDPWLPFLDDLGPLLRRLGDLVDLYDRRVTAADKPPYQRTFAQYRSGVQLDLVVGQVPEELQRRPDWVVLHDPDDRVKPAQNRSATLEDVRAWAYEGWEHLSACAKYLARGSLWEAHDQLNATRTQIWRLWAVARNIPDPQYGLTAVLDDEQKELPLGIDATVAGLSTREVRRAALVCADLLASLWPHAVGAVHASPLGLPALAGYVRDQLASLPD